MIVCYRSLNKRSLSLPSTEPMLTGIALAKRAGDRIVASVASAARRLYFAVVRRSRLRLTTSPARSKPGGGRQQYRDDAQRPRSRHINHARLIGCYALLIRPYASAGS